jgi:hypothetical protein
VLCFAVLCCAVAVAVAVAVAERRGFMYNEVFVAWTNNQLFHDDRLKNVQYPYDAKAHPQLVEMAERFRGELGLAALQVPYGRCPPLPPLPASCSLPPASFVCAEPCDCVIR